ncbi:MAG: hypothetical protein J6P49_03195 [Paludibacteraceae bacterium]|nr:hypothetical protein [Paludibacteraceae bacterium]MBO7338153.1 hypothetical protein [Paludibacteraceae bacterium]MBP5136746.1 hypothetical protein [Paludibacteraceae bacterium]
MRKIGCSIAAILLVALAVFVYVKFYFVFGEGVKAGELNYFVNKGYVFKTYEGKLIQAGFKGQAANTIVSNEFIFSVEDEAVADSLMKCSSRTVELHYKEYLGTLPWRGVSKFVVDGIVSVH